MTEAERELIIKEARLAAVHDIEMAFAKLSEVRGQHDPELNTLVSIFMQFIRERWSEVFNDKGDRWKPSRAILSDDGREVVVAVLNEIVEAIDEAIGDADSEVGRDGAGTVRVIGRAIKRRIRQIESPPKQKHGYASRGKSEISESE